MSGWIEYVIRVAPATDDGYLTPADVDALRPLIVEGVPTVVDVHDVADFSGTAAGRLGVLLAGTPTDWRVTLPCPAGNEFVDAVCRARDAYLAVEAQRLAGGAA